MGLNDQVGGGLNTRTFRSNIFKEGIKPRFIKLKSKERMLFKILPAFDFRDYNNMNAFLPFILPDGQLTDWANLIYVSRFVGHGKGRFSNKMDIVSMMTGHPESEREKVFCPLKEVIRAIDSYKGDWGYLMDKNAEDRAISMPVQMMICNIIELSGRDGVQVGVFPGSATVAMFGTEGGLVFRRTMVDDATLARNYLLGYEVNDMTHPKSGPVLECLRLSDKGEFSGYGMFLAKDNANRPFSVDTSSYLQYRARIYDLNQVVNMPSEEQIVQSLIAALNGRSPAGNHEYDLLRLALPQFKIPASPQAPAAGPTVQAGFGGNPATGGIGVQAPVNVPNNMPAYQNVPNQLQPVQPQAPINNSFVPGQMSPPAPTSLPQAPQQPASAPMPYSLPPPPQQPAQAPQAQYSLPPAPQAPQQPIGLPQVPAGLPSQAPAAPQLPQIPHQTPLPAGLPPAPQQPSAGPVVPGDHIPLPVGANFTRDSFMSKLNNMKSGAV